jgi:hypothetical protein
MPNYDFRCPEHGFFEAVSWAAAEGGVYPQPCPKCNVLMPMVWINPPAMRNDDVHVTKIGGRMFSNDYVENVLAASTIDPDDDSDAFYNKPDFVDRWKDADEKMAALAIKGDLPPLVPEDANSQKVFAEAAKSMKE